MRRRSVLQLTNQFAFETHDGLRIVQRIAVDEKNVLGAVAQRIDLGRVQIDVEFDEAARDPRQQTGPRTFFSSTAMR